MKRLVLLVALLGLANLASVQAQELNCQVQVTHQQIQNSNQLLFQNMQKVLYEFMNNTKWTDQNFLPHEKIDCTILVNLTDFNGSDRYTATLQVQARRPVYGSSYFSPLINYRDQQLTFEYLEGMVMEFNPNRFTNNLLSVLAYYAYLIIGMDFDSYAMEAGTPYFQQAQLIVDNAAGATNSGPGWQAFEGLENRHWLVKQLLEEDFRGLRRASYRYHRLGLDLMSTRLESGRAEIAESFRLIQQVYRQKPTAHATRVFFTAKADEIVNIFSHSTVPSAEKTSVYNIVAEADPANIQKYEALKR